jgi:hypothetical protein
LGLKSKGSADKFFGFVALFVYNCKKIEGSLKERLYILFFIAIIICRIDVYACLDNTISHACNTSMVNHELDVVSSFKSGVDIISFFSLILEDQEDEEELTSTEMLAGSDNFSAVDIVENVQLLKPSDLTYKDKYLHRKYASHLSYCLQPPK